MKKLFGPMTSENATQDCPQVENRPFPAFPKGPFRCIVEVSPKQVEASTTSSSFKNFLSHQLHNSKEDEHQAQALLIAAAVAVATSLIAGPTQAPEAHAFGLSSSSNLTKTITTTTTSQGADNVVVTPVSDGGVNIEKMKSVSVGNWYYEGRSEWAFLSNPKMVVPVGRITTPGGTVCSVGHIATKGADKYIITAGHCGTVGTEFGIRNATGRWVKIGTMENSFNVGGDDWGIIKISNDNYTQTKIPVDLPTGAPLAASEAASADAICVLGQSSGLSCGSYLRTPASGRLVIEGVSTHGDSGGTVFALVNDVMRPIGILEGGYDGTNELAVQPLDRIQVNEGVSVIF